MVDLINNLDERFARSGFALDKFKKSSMLNLLILNKVL